MFTLERMYNSIIFGDGYPGTCGFQEKVPTVSSQPVECQQAINMGQVKVTPGEVGVLRLGMTINFRIRRICFDKKSLRSFEDVQLSDAGRTCLMPGFPSFMLAKVNLGIEVSAGRIVEVSARNVSGAEATFACALHGTVIA